MKKPPDIYVQPHGKGGTEKRQTGQFTKFIGSVGKVVVKFDGTFWSPSFGQHIPRVYSPRQCAGNYFPAKKNEMNSAAGSWQFQAGSSQQRKGKGRQ